MGPFLDLLRVVRDNVLSAKLRPDLDELLALLKEQPVPPTATRHRLYPWLLLQLWARLQMLHAGISRAQRDLEREIVAHMREGRLPSLYISGVVRAERDGDELRIYLEGN
jgi:hypothetical protein